MRNGSIALLFASCSCLLTACYDYATNVNEGGGGASGTTTSTGGTGGAAPLARGAWAVSFLQPDAVHCMIASHNTMVGQLTADQKTKLYEDGEDITAGDDATKVDVSCRTIAEGATMRVDAYEAANGSFLTLSIPELSPSATKDNPSKGIVVYQSQQTANSMTQADCDVYFLPGTPQGVSEGQMFLTFECGALVASADNVCEIAPGYAAFESCVTAD